MFTNALGFIKNILGSAGIFTPILAAFGVTVPPLAIALIPIITGLMTQAEEALGDGTGPLKKSFVQSGALQLVEGMKQISTGGQKETWESINPNMVSGVIDVVATVANEISKNTGSGNLFDDSSYQKTQAF